MAVDYCFPVLNENLCSLEETLKNKTNSMALRFQALFSLRSLDSDAAVNKICSAFSDPSALLKHEICYVLGQMRRPQAINFLSEVLMDKNEDHMVRHEAAEALGAIGNNCALNVLKEMRDNLNAPEVVRQTCELAVCLLEFEGKCESPYLAIDPAPCLSDSLPATVVADIMMDKTKSLFDRYRAMFSLRNINNTEAVDLLAKGFKDSSALFRHEIAYVYGQMQNPDSVKYLRQVINDKNEVSMVRHEAAEALGSVGTKECKEILQQYTDCEDDVVRESCLVGLDMWEENV